MVPQWFWLSVEFQAGDTMKLRVALCIGMLFVSLGHGQEKPARLTFEVAAIRPTPPDARYGGIKPMPGGDGYLVQNMPVITMFSLMYKVPGRQIKGGQDWLETSRWDI